MPLLFFFFFFNDTATTEIYTLSLHDALPIYHRGAGRAGVFRVAPDRGKRARAVRPRRHPRGVKRAYSPSRVIDRKSTRLNSSHGYISYAVFCLKKKKKKEEKVALLIAK